MIQVQEGQRGWDFFLAMTGSLRKTGLGMVPSDWAEGRERATQEAMAVD